MQLLTVACSAIATRSIIGLITTVKKTAKNIQYLDALIVQVDLYFLYLASNI